MGENEAKEMGKRIREFADGKGVNYQDIAAAAGVDRSYLSRVMNGDIEPSRDMLYKLGLTMRLSTNYVLYGNGPRELLPEGHPLNGADPDRIRRITALLDLPNGLNGDVRELREKLEKLIQAFPEKS